MVATRDERNAIIFLFPEGVDIKKKRLFRRSWKDRLNETTLKKEMTKGQNNVMSVVSVEELKTQPITRTKAMKDK